MVFNTILSAALLLARVVSQVRAGSLGPLQQNPDGSCVSYLVQSGDYCDKIAQAKGVHSTADLELYNAKTWAWNGCLELQG
jgi:hypothetical protein